MQQPVVLPDGLADLPPGPELAVLLAGIDPTRVANHDTVTVLQAWRRQRSHTDAAELAILAEVGHCDPFAPAGRIARLEDAPADCGLEIAAALTLTEVTAWREYALADTVIHRLPAVHASLTSGAIDRAKAMLFADYLEPLTDAQNARICTTLLPQAPGLTTGQLRARLRRMVFAIDPEAARRRYRKALQQRRLVCYLDEDGTATLTATGLDPTAAQAACERVDGLARELRAAGHPEPLPAIRADLSTALQDGSLHTLSHDEIIAVMLARATAPDTDTDTDTDESSSTGTGAATGTAGGGTDSDSVSGTSSGSESDSATGTGSDTGAGTETTTGAHHNTATGTGDLSDHDSDSNSGTGSGTDTDANSNSGSTSGSTFGTGTDRSPGSASGSDTDTGSNSGTGSTGDSAQHGANREHGADSSDSGRHGGACTETNGDTDNPSEDDDGNSPGDSDSATGGDTDTDADYGSGCGSDAGGDTNGAGDSNSEGTDDGGDGDGSGPGDADDDSDGDGDSDDGPHGGVPSGGGGGGAPRGGGPGGGPGSGGGGARPIPERARPGIEIRLRLSTLLGHDDHPGEIPGLGPIPAHTARDCLARQQYAEWRFAITDADGYLILAGVTRRRPPRHPGPGGRPLIRQAHGGTVELQIPATLLEHLAADPPPGWEPLIADLTAQYANRATLLAELDRRSGERFPHPALRRHVEVRDRTCVFPGCRRPARKAQQDHTDDHQHGGPTTSENLGPLCVFHHAIKTAGRWRVRQPAPGVFRWRSPLGRTYTTRGEPVCPPLPDPLPDPEADFEQVEAVPGLGSPLQAEFDERPLFPTPPEEPEPEEPAEAPEPTETTDRAPPDEPPF